MKKNYTFLLIISLAVFSNCDKDDETKILTNEGIIMWSGPYAGDGCGFFVKIKNVFYKPEDESVIDDSYKTNTQTTVIIQYEVLNRKIETICGLLPSYLQNDGIKILTIEKK